MPFKTVNMDRINHSVRIEPVYDEILRRPVFACVQVDGCDMPPFIEEARHLYCKYLEFSEQQFKAILREKKEFQNGLEAKLEELSRIENTQTNNSYCKERENFDSQEQSLASRYQYWKDIVDAFSYTLRLRLFTNFDSSTRKWLYRR